MIISTLNGNVVMLEFGVEKGTGLSEADVAAMLKHAAGSPSPSTSTSTSTSTTSTTPTSPPGWEKWGETAIKTLSSGSSSKDERGYLEAKLKQDMVDAEEEDMVYGIFKNAIRENAFNDVRSDGRGLDEIREVRNCDHRDKLHYEEHLRRGQGPHFRFAQCWLTRRLHLKNSAANGSCAVLARSGSRVGVFQQGRDSGFELVHLGNSGECLDDEASI